MAQGSLGAARRFSLRCDPHKDQGSSIGGPRAESCPRAALDWSPECARKSSRGEVRRQTQFSAGCLASVLLGLIPMEGHTTGEILFTKIFPFFEVNNLDLAHVNMLVTDGAPLIAGLAARMAAVAPQMILLHCLIHQSLLCAKLR
ncbi:unnamed protein product, partial [Pleuronectes platessa]